MTDLPPKTRRDPSDRARSPMFLERGTYQRRRLTDAAFLLPVLGLLLFSAPILWPLPSDPQGGSTMPMSRAILYIFGAWGLLIVCAALFGRRTRQWRVGRTAATGQTLDDH